MIDLPIGIARLRATFPDRCIIDDSERGFAVRRHVLTASTPADVATRLAVLGYPPGITPAS